MGKKLCFCCGCCFGSVFITVTYISLLWYLMVAIIAAITAPAYPGLAFREVVENAMRWDPRLQEDEALNGPSPYMNVLQNADEDLIFETVTDPELRRDLAEVVFFTYQDELVPVISDVLSNVGRTLQGFVNLRDRIRDMWDFDQDGELSTEELGSAAQDAISFMRCLYMAINTDMDVASKVYGDSALTGVFFNATAPASVYTEDELRVAWEQWHEMMVNKHGTAWTSLQEDIRQGTLLGVAMQWTFPRVRENGDTNIASRIAFLFAERLHRNAAAHQGIHDIQISSYSPTKEKRRIRQRQAQRREL